MSLFEVLEKRRSIRAYRQDPVEDEKLRKVLSAGLLAPTACNYQPFFIIVRTGAGEVGALKPVYDRKWFYTAPVVLAVCCDNTNAWVRKYDGKNHGEIDAAIVMDHIILAATELGLGTCWIAAFDPGEARKAFRLPEQVTPVVLTPLGYPAEEPDAKPRKELEAVVRRMSF